MNGAALSVYPRSSSTSRHLLSQRTGSNAPLHVPSYLMEDSASNHPRRRSSSIASVVSLLGRNNSLKTKSTRRSDNILEADEDRASDDDISASTQNSASSESENTYSDDGLEDDEETGLTGKERSKRRRRKRRNTHLDERIARDQPALKDGENVASKAVMRNLSINILLISLWYLFSVAISLYNKWMFKDNTAKESENIFPFPLFTTCIHQIVQFTLAALVLLFVPSFRPRHDSLGTHHGGNLRQDFNDPKKPLMTKWFYISRVGPCGLGNALDIGLGNMSLKFITLTFFTMCKSSVLGFVLIFAFLFRLEKPTWRLVSIIATMTVGVMMMVAGEISFKLLGFVLVMMASCASGFRWSLTQILLVRHPATSNPFSTICYLSPVMFSCLLILALPVEGPLAIREGLRNLLAKQGNLWGILILLFPGCLAFAMTTSEFALLKRTSVVTLSICGIFKEVVMIGAASLVYHDKLTPINLVGLCITIVSIAAYNYLKIQTMREDARRDTHLAADNYRPVLSSEPPEDSRSNAEPMPTRQTTQHLIKNSLSMPSGAPFAIRDLPIVDNPARASPLKRPENMD